MAVLSTFDFISSFSVGTTPRYCISFLCFMEDFNMTLQNFIVFEGIDGAGTTTQIRLLKARTEGKRFLFTTEPTSAPTGTFLRSMLSGKIPLIPQTAAYLFAADRSEHVDGPLIIDGKDTLVTGVKTACDQGYTVVSDRYLFSSLAYQSIDCGMDLPARLNEQFALPRLLFFFDIDPAVSLTRVNRRGQTEIYEKQDFQNRTRDAYEKVLEHYQSLNTGMKIIRLDATQSPGQISDFIWKHIQANA